MDKEFLMAIDTTSNATVHRLNPEAKGFLTFQSKVLLSYFDKLDSNAYSLSIPYFAFCSMEGVKICNILTSGALINVDLLKNCTFVLLKENRLITKTIDKFSTSFQININAISDILDKQSSGNNFLGVYGVYNKIEVNRNLMIENKDDTFKFYDFL